MIPIDTAGWPARRRKQMDRNTIATILGIPATHQAFTFEDKRFEYYPATEGKAETLFTHWADGSRDVTGQTRDLGQSLAVLLSHGFRKGVSAAERAAILDRARAALAAR